MDLSEKHSPTQNRHPWELARRAIISHELNGLSKKVLDVGGGDGFIGEFIQSLGHDIQMVDPHFPKQIVDNKLRFTNLNDIEKQTDVLIMMDVLEHVSDDSQLLSDSIEKLKPGGRIIITVPALQVLYGEHDKRLGHHRRYEAQQLIQLAQRFEIKIEKCHYFFSSLLPLRYLTKDNQKKNDITRWSYSEQHLFSKFVTKVLLLDYLINKYCFAPIHGIPGLSLILTGTKNE